MDNCPACGAGELVSKTDELPTEWEGRTGEVTLHSSICEGCGSEVVNQAQSAINKENVLAFRRGE